MKELEMTYASIAYAAHDALVLAGVVAAGVLGPTFLYCVYRRLKSVF